MSKKTKKQTKSYGCQQVLLHPNKDLQYGEKPDNWEASAKRIKRGLYQSAAGCLINADCNGAANIRKNCIWKAQA
ncbi:hypothetical protein PJF56_21580 [Roseofilum sp. BLCC_M91]|uniref:Transposase n=1 Tax=Roseofilum halophilum BLCC-M91 TaxID=3022259 RepID=A0ABT7BQU9_9CYAN|nr:hypothetical protein [Roseofilum halophilum]MDJ1181460.1 hypothetical protein [Roseofilum halophilum BLCC-M91]